LQVTLALDLDRVIFDTNTYFRSLDGRLKSLGTSFEQVFRGETGRKGIDILFDRLALDFGPEKAREVVFSGMAGHLSREVARVARKVTGSGGKVFIVSVGNRYQLDKVKGFPCDDVFVVADDTEKVRRAASLKPALFVDDKRWVVEQLRGRGVDARQALWFLDEEHRQGAMEDALDGPDELSRAVDKLLNGGS
jgi:hypothetical protein